MCPPGTDQTGRMPQRWRIIVPAISQAQVVKNVEELARKYSTHTDPRAGHTGRLDFGSKLARYGALSFSARENMERGLTFKASTQCSKLLSLPVEIINCVFESLDYHGVVNFGLTCEVLLRLALEHIDRDVRNYAAPWADQPLAILGNYLRDLPPSFFENGLAYNSVNRADLIAMDTDNGLSFIPRRFHHLPARQFLWATTTKFEYLSQENLRGLASWLDTLDKPEPPGLYMDYPQRVILKSALSQARVAECCFMNDTQFNRFGHYLRNLTTKSLVRLCACDGIDKAHVRLRNADSVLTEKYMLDDVMLVQTRWSEFGPENFNRMRYFAADPRGPWAGHRFDIVTVRAHDKQVAAGGMLEWHDVTEHVLTNVAWEQDYAAGTKSIGLSCQNNAAREEWRSYMNEVRMILRHGGDSVVLVEEIFGWTAKIKEICRNKGSSATRALSQHIMPMPRPIILPDPFGTLTRYDARQP